MINLKHYNEPALDFLDEAIRSKRNSPKDPSYKTRLQALRAEIETHFGHYDTHFGENNLQSLIARNYAGQEKKDILTLYSYRSVIMQKLKLGVTTIELNRVVNTCQNCTIGEVNSFDHIVPQNEFPEFVVHPKNLFPSCSLCNGYKSDNWRKNGNCLFLNLYLDQLPNLPYLFVSANIRSGDIQVKFSVSNPNGIDFSLFSKIEHHYKTLHLCDRFSRNIDKVVTPLKHSIASSLGKLTIKDAAEIAMATANRNRIAFGFNYWKSILELELLSSPAFLQMCKDEK